MTGRHRRSTAAPVRGGGTLRTRRGPDGTYAVPLSPLHAAPPDWYAAGWAAALTTRRRPCSG